MLSGSTINKLSSCFRSFLFLGRGERDILLEVLLVAGVIGEPTDLPLRVCIPPEVIGIGGVR